MISPRTRIQSQGAYTLVEVLAVIAIAALLASASLPAIRGVMNSDNLDTKSNLVYNLLTLARSQAISLRTPVQLRMATDLWQQGSGANDTSSCYKKMSLWKLQQDDPSNSDNPAWTPTWVQLSTWQTLGSSIVFEMAPNPTTVYTFSASNNPATAGYSYFLSPTYTSQTLTTATGPAVVTSPGQSLGNGVTADWVALEFMPTGGLNTGTGNLNIYLLLTPGSYNGTAMAYTQKTLSNWSQIRISSLTGMLSVVRP